MEEGRHSIECAVLCDGKFPTMVWSYKPRVIGNVLDRTLCTLSKRPLLNGKKVRVDCGSE